MVAIRKHAPADAPAESLALLAGKIDSMDSRHTATLDGVREDVAGLQVGQIALQQGQSVLQQDVTGLKQGQSNLERNQDVLMENQLGMKAQLNTMQSQLDLLVAHLIRPAK